ncbi:hypothetical protein BJV78DRAFT_1174599 [Lactifluus subvellereus]|nr:hypothetical protein BJV78DRAFT_1174599 [Lactifluus subvellereus]
MPHPGPAPFTLDVIIVGGSIAGLSAAVGLTMSGHKVRVLERGSGLEKPCGGIRLQPNVTKILVQWGLEEELIKRASPVHGGTNIWDYETGKLLGFLQWPEPVMRDSGAKFYMIRFSDLHDILYNAAVRAGAQVIFNTNVRSASPPSLSGLHSTAHTSRERPSVQLSDGTVLEADLIIGADGQHSTVRTSVLGTLVKPKRTGTIVLSGNVPMNKVLEDDVTSGLAHSRTYWMGSHRCFFGYPTSRDTEYSVNMFWERNEPDVPESWFPNISTKSLKLSESTSDPKLTKMFEKMESVYWQNYLAWPEFENWSDDSARIVLLGEAARPLIPCSLQSCSVSVEGAAVFSTLLSYLRGFDHIPMLVRAYETIRRDRTEFLHQVEVSSVTQAMYPPGPERIARDQEMQKNLETGQTKWDDDAYLGLWGQICEVWAYNAFDAADDWWVQWGVLREHSLRLQNSHIETLFHPLEVSVTAHTNLIQDTSRA